jgi:anti-sigma factor RsiW
MARESIERYLDGELPSNEAAVLESHLEACPRCRQELSAAREVLEGLHGLPVLRCPDRVTNDVFERVRGSAGAQAPPRRSVAGLMRWLAGARLLPRPALAGAFVVLAVLSAIVIDRREKPEDQITAAEIEEAEAAVKWTFAYVSHVGRRSGLAVRDEVLEIGVMRPMERALRSAIDGDTRTRKSNNGGSI